MSIFSNKSTGRVQEQSDPATTEVPGMRNRNGTEPSGEINIVGKGVIIDGNLHVNGDVRVGGRINGEVKVDNRIVVAPEGIIVGGIITADGDLAGTVEGDVTATGRLVIRGTASVQGKVSAANLSVEEGASLSGRFEVGKPTRLGKEGPKLAKKPETRETRETTAGNSPTLIPMQ